LTGPDNRPVAEAMMLSRLCVSESGNKFRSEPVVVHDGRFEIHGMDPEKSVPVCFLDAKNELGAVAEISGKSAPDQPLVVRLAPCGKAVARFVDPSGKPLVKYEPMFQIVVTPGPFKGDKRARSGKELAADQDFVANFDRMHYSNQKMMITTDRQGRSTFPALIPGATYRIQIYHDSEDWGEKDFTVKSGETLDLGDIVIKNV
jgi:hypothetical protein